MQKKLEDVEKSNEEETFRQLDQMVNERRKRQLEIDEKEKVGCEAGESQEEGGEIGEMGDVSF